MTDAGPDQMLFMGSPSTGSEHKFTTGKRVVVSATNSRATIYNYVIELTLEAGSSLKGDFAAGSSSLLVLVLVTPTPLISLVISLLTMLRLAHCKSALTTITPLTTSNSTTRSKRKLWAAPLATKQSSLLLSAN